MKLNAFNVIPGLVIDAPGRDRLAVITETRLDVERELVSLTGKILPDYKLFHTSLDFNDPVQVRGVVHLNAVRGDDVATSGIWEEDAIDMGTGHTDMVRKHIWPSETTRRIVPTIAECGHPQYNEEGYCGEMPCHNYAGRAQH